ncbi:DUF4982 domain-containing protein [Thalassobellus suaedae]|uniref:DUF4982 domain-containing protein n=1 Tax=Thalassobellus suaedae TaxID=3074124 RepID=A0ABY9XP01_9FLAO|nr:DUF4982 domain-containing protein [Flavobacteriaceae bacterium HL-DH14]
MLGTSRGFTSGLLDLAGNIKPRGYFRQSLWSKEPMVYIGTTKKTDNPNRSRRGNQLSTDAPKIWNYESGSKIQVLCYTNCDEAELYLNEKLVGERKSYDIETGVIAWDVDYQEGELKVLAFKNGEEMATDNIVTNTLASTINTKVITPTDNELIRQIKVEILDTNGNPSILADNEITCRVNGGELLGMENASTNVAENYLDSKHRCINGKLLIYVKKEENNTPISVSLSSPLLKSVELKID